MQLTLTTKIDIPQQSVEDVLTTAIEGGIAYWAEGSHIERRPDLTVYSATLWDWENPHERFLVDADAMLKGIRLLHEAIMSGDVHPDSEIGGQFLHHLFNDEEGIEYVDAVCADAIVQMACFGRLEFG